jgi:Na+/H+-dicarboxylate symporter
MSMAAGYGIIPHIVIDNATEGIRELPEVAFQLDIPQIMPVMSALVLSVLIGQAAVWTKAGTVISILEEFQQIVLKIVEYMIIPVLPFYIAATFCGLAWEGSITKQFPIFLIVIAIVLVGHIIWLAVLYGVASVYSGSSGLEVIKHYGPAYLTAIGTMSSAATLGVAL